jgi:two-component system, chemotaxis family, sensor kinase CheA
MGVRSKKLERQFIRSFSDAEIEDKIAALWDVLKDDAVLAPQSIFLAQFGSFFDGLEDAYIQSDNRVTMAARCLQISSDELYQANRSLESLNSTIQAMLEGLGQGLLFFDKQGLCSPIHSRACFDLLETSPAGQHIADILHLPPNEHHNFIEWINMVFGGRLVMRFEELAELAPATYAHSQGLFIKLNYRPLYGKDKQLKNILVIATDHTRERIAQIQAADNISHALRTLRISRNRNYFLRFVRQFRELFFENEGGYGCLEQFRRDIHTLKGLTGVFQLRDLEELLHKLESDLSGIHHVADVLGIMQDYYEHLHVHFDSSLAFAKEVLGDEFEQMGGMISMPTQKIIDFSENVKHELALGTSPEQIVTLILQNLAATSIHDALIIFDVQLQEYAERMGVKVHPCVFLGENFSILLDKYQSVISSFVHVVRNLVDHAFDVPKTRERFGKDPEGTVHITTTRQDNYFYITIADDGNGINVDALRHKLSKTVDSQQLASETDESIIQHIFDDNVSVRATVSQISGRGVGMSAVKAEIERLGGEIRVASDEGEGTTLHIRLPFIWN